MMLIFRQHHHHHPKSQKHHSPDSVRVHSLRIGSSATGLRLVNDILTTRAHQQQQQRGKMARYDAAVW